uniref:AIG1-type G domain-containing protein n=1 Tax=Cyprinus carpio TaxID=7962 RepID=A0A8C2IW73_CYPCA
MADKSSRKPVVLPKEEIRVVLLGSDTDVKAYCRNTILGLQIFSESSSTLRFFDRHAGIVLGRRVVIINTPNLLDLIHFSEEHDMRRFSHLNSPVHALLLVLKPEIFTNFESDTFNRIDQIFGEGASEYVIVVFMHEDQEYVNMQDLKTASRAMESLQQTCRQPIHHLKRNEDDTQVQKLLESIDKIVEENGGHYLMISEESRPVKKKQLALGKCLSPV